MVASFFHSSSVSRELDIISFSFKNYYKSVKVDSSRLGRRAAVLISPV